MHPHSAAFDLGLARYSLALEVVCYTVIAFMPTALTFTVFAMLASWGGGFNPAVQALALELYTRRHKSREEAETGKLFGALSVVQAMWCVVCLWFFESILISLSFTPIILYILL